MNNASALGPSPMPILLDFPLAVLADLYAANVLAPLAILQALRGELHPGARILNITSDAAVEPYAGWGGYGSSKAALGAAFRHSRRRTAGKSGLLGGSRRHADANAPGCLSGEDIGDRPLPEVSVPGLLTLLTGDSPVAAIGLRPCRWRWVNHEHIACRGPYRHTNQYRDHDRITPFRADWRHDHRKIERRIAHGAGHLVCCPAFSFPPPWRRASFA